MAAQMMQRAIGPLRTSLSLKQQQTTAPAGLPLAKPLRQQLPMRQRSTIMAAVETKKPTPEGDKPEVAKLADSIGLPTEEGLFGFKPFPEVWVGRLAMMGFLLSMVFEFGTGKGTLQQLGLPAPSTPLLLLICTLSGGATLFATVNTLVKAQQGKLEPQTVDRYKAFLGVVPDEEINAEADALKKVGDFTSPDDFKAIAEARAEGTPADKFLDMSGAEEDASQAAAELKDQEQRAQDADKKGTSVSLGARSDIMEQSSAQAQEWAYARQVEVTNGRWAMIGFLGSTIVEAATGRGIIGQVVMYLKALNILGPASGF